MDNRGPDAGSVAEPKVVDRTGTALVFWGLIPMTVLVLAFAGMCLDRQWCASTLAPGPCTDEVRKIAAMGGTTYECPPGAVVEVGKDVIVCRCPRPDAGVSP